jgi:hypothetical protein
MKITQLIAAVLVLGTAGGAALASTLAFTEGRRDTVAGSKNIERDVRGSVNSQAPGFRITKNGRYLGAGSLSQIDVHGVIVNRHDSFRFRAKSAFSVSFIGAGFESKNPSNCNSTWPTLTKLGGQPNSIRRQFSTDDPGGPLNLSGGPGKYKLTLSGDGGAALYDLRIAVVPLPATGIMLLFAVGGFAMMRKQKSKTS